MAAGASIGWDNQGLPTTVYPDSACITAPAVKLAAKALEDNNAKMVTSASYKADSTAAFITQAVEKNSAVGKLSCGVSFVAAMAALASGFFDGFGISDAL